MDKFELFKLKEKFIADTTIFYPGIADPAMRPLLTEKINLAADDFKKLAESGTATDKKYQELISTGLQRFQDIYLDTEDRERVCHYFQELMDIVGLKSSDGQLNSFMYSDFSGTNSTSGNPDILEGLKYQKAWADTLFNHHKDRLIVYAKLADKEEPIQIVNGNFPDNVETTYNLLKDSSGRIISSSEFPLSESGDWNIIFTHYFDKDGKTFAFERQTNFFNSICTNGIAFETRTEFYDSTFHLVAKFYKLVDEEKRTLQKDSCQFPYDFEYKISSDIDEYLQSNKLKKQPR